MMPALRIIAPGPLTTVQDAGRPHAIASGVPPGGAMDRFAHAAGNMLVANDRGAASLECTLRGPHLEAEGPCLVAITGADLEPRINGAEAPLWTAFQLHAGDRLTFGGRRSGARAYLAVAGGIVADRWLGSMSTNLMVGRGGMHGRALIQGDVITVGEAASRAAPELALPDDMRPTYDDHSLHALAGPHAGPPGAPRAWRWPRPPRCRPPPSSPQATSSGSWKRPSSARWRCVPLSARRWTP